MTTQQATTPFYIFFSRIFWMVLGPMFLVLSLLAILGGEGWFTLADLMFAILLGGILLARWIESRSGEARLATGEPATPAQLQRYFLVAAIVGLCIWVTGNLVGNYWLAN